MRDVDEVREALQRRARELTSEIAAKVNEASAIEAALSALNGDELDWTADPDQSPPRTNVVRLPSAGRPAALGRETAIEDVEAALYLGIDRPAVIARELGVSPSTVYRHLKRLTRDQLVEQRIGGRWQLTELGRAQTWIENRARELGAQLGRAG